MTELLIATGNAGKVREFEALFRKEDLTLYSLKDFPGIMSSAEDGTTFKENAIKKASSAAMQTGLPTIADDSGLCVDALDGEPGVLSARYAGEGVGDVANNLKLLKEMATIPMSRRKAAFRCVIAYCTPEGFEATFTGELQGIILEKSSGSGGFGYDPLFMVPEYGKTLAELPMEIKNRISHRGRAAEALKAYLVKNAFLQSKA